MEIPNSDNDDEEEIELLASSYQDRPTQPENQRLLKSTAHFIDRILTQLNNIDIPTSHQQERQYATQTTSIAAPNSQNPFFALPASTLSKVKPLMLTLHCLFPNELLPALDLLDRGLVRCLFAGENEVQQQQGTAVAMGPSDTSFPSSTMPSFPAVNGFDREAIFLVVSVSSVSAPTPITGTDTARPGDDKGYEVRLEAWNCTCPAFALCAFQGLDSDSDSDPEPVLGLDMMDRDNIDQGAGQYRFGGTLTRGYTRLSPPACKHLLACMLLVRCPRLFGTDSRLLVSKEELAGWCAGWGG